MPSGGAREGAGRHPYGPEKKRVSLTVWIRPDLKNTLKTMDGSISAFVEKAIIRELQLEGKKKK